MCSIMLRIIVEEAMISASILRVTGAPGIQGHKNPNLASDMGLLVWASTLSRPWTLAPHPVPQHPEEAGLPSALTCPGSQDLRSLVTTGFQDFRGSLTPRSFDKSRISGSQDPESQNHRDSWTWKRSVTTRITGETDSSQRQKRAGCTRDNQIVRSKHKNITNRNQGYLVSSEPSYPTIASPGCPITPEKKDSDLRSLLMMMIENFKKDINYSLEEKWENTGK